MPAVTRFMLSMIASSESLSMSFRLEDLMMISEMSDSVTESVTSRSTAILPSTVRSPPSSGVDEILRIRGVPYFVLTRKIMPLTVFPLMA